MLAFESVNKRFAGRSALQDVTLDVNAGECVALLGPSGGGKSTLLRIATGLEFPDSGRVRIEGVEWTPARARELRRRMGYVIQEGGLFPHLTARENVLLVPRRLRWTRERIEHRLDELSAITHLPPGALDRYPSQLSGGQRQRVGLMRALVLDPPLLLLDEPLGALDPVVRRELQDDLRALFRRLRKAVLLVTHDLAEAAYLGSRLVLLNEGRIAQQGRLRDLVEHPADEFVSRFVNAYRSPPELANLASEDA